MAPSRRRDRDEFEQDGDSTPDARGARLNHGHSKKRARVSIDERPRQDPRQDSDSGPDPEPEPETESDGDRDDRNHNGVSQAPDDNPSMTQYEILRDGDFSHLEHINEDDQRCTQLLELRHTHAVLVENRVADNGIIESIECINFMCHERLRVKLGPLLNFVVGENGSGKSAVLTAITICLGGKASATNRGGSLRALIKEGKDTARLTVVLKNQGEGAYKPDLFGNKIIIERQFSKNGNPSFKLKSVQDRTISTKKADVDNITEYFALQVDNPLNILSQDSARQFLNASSAAQKYNFWVRGVNLQALDQDYRVVQDLVTSNEEHHQGFRRTIEYLEKKKVDARRLVQDVDRNAELKNRHKLLRWKLIWAQVVEKERLLDKYEKNLEDIDAKISEHQGIVQALEGVHVDISERVNNAKNESDRLKEDAIEYDTKVDDAKYALGQAMNVRAELHTEERAAKASLDRLKKTLDAKNMAVQRELTRLEDLNGGKLDTLKTGLMKAKGESIDLESQVAQCKQDMGDTEKLVLAAKDQVAQIKQQLHQKKSDISQSRESLKILSKGSNDIYLAFGARTRQLLSAIERDAGFQEKPVGPIGLHLHLSESKWAMLIDMYLGNNLEAFVVTNHADNVRLRGLMKNMGVSSPIITSSRQRVDTNGKEPAASVATILRLLTFDDALCRTPLIIGNSIEQTSLIEDRKDAERFMFLDDGTKPRNVGACITFNDGNRSEGILVSNTRDGSSSTPMRWRRKVRIPRLHVNDASRLALEEDTLKGMEDNMRALDATCHRAIQAFNDHNSDLNRGKGHLLNLEKQYRKKNSEISGIEDSIANLQGEEDQLQLLEEEFEKSKDQWNTQGNQFGDLVAKKEEHGDAVAAAESVVELRRGEREQQNLIRDTAVQRHSQLITAMTMALARKNKAYEEMEMETFAKTRMEAKCAAQKDEVASLTTDAEGACPGRVSIAENETHEGLEKQYRGISKQIKDRQRQQGKSDEEITQDFIQAKKELKNAMTGLNNCSQDIKTLKKALGQRLVQWRQFQRSISSFTRCNFEMLLAERNFRGQVVLEHKQKKLVVEVEPDETRRDASGRSTKTLSGGEKSYSSICLLLAIWEAMGSPLRCLDEFDVFMDNVNRAISTKLLISAARKSVGRQFIFITPNAIEGAQAQLGDDVTIHRLTDPRQRRVDDMMDEGH